MRMKQGLLEHSSFRYGAAMNDDIRFCETPLLRVAFRDGGPEDGRPALLLHGWPDDATTYDGVAPVLHVAGWRTCAPWLRGFGATRFRETATLRSGEMAALAQDALDLADAMRFDRFAVIGHDWGARVAAVLASTHAERISHCVMLSTAWEPGMLQTPPLAQSRAYWYQWFMATGRGQAFVREHGKAFAREMWNTWGPTGWFDDADFEAVAHAFDNPDWPEVTLHSYRVRWQEDAPDARYAVLAAAQFAAKTIAVPTLMLQGEVDRVSLPRSSEGKERFYSAGYERRLLANVGHFPTREAPARVASLVAEFLSRDL
jgi:pimeloyl-ACP methyl ester carboxylesterase